MDWSTTLIIIGFFLVIMIEGMFGWKWLLYDQWKKKGMLPCNHRNKHPMNPTLEHFWCSDCEHTVNYEGWFIWDIPSPKQPMLENEKHE